VSFHAGQIFYGAGRAGERQAGDHGPDFSTPVHFLSKENMKAAKIGELLATWGGQFSAAIASGASTTTLKTGPARLCRIVITTAGTASFTVFDNTAGSGTVLFASTATTTLGTVYDIQMPAQIGITVVNQASGAAFTVSFN
jgi:hypothetical protein